MQDPSTVVFGPFPPPTTPSLSDIELNRTYLAACRVGGALVNPKDIPFWPRRVDRREPVTDSEEESEENDDDEGNPLCTVVAM